jgi:hypothetical protein
MKNGTGQKYQFKTVSYNTDGHQTDGPKRYYFRFALDAVAQENFQTRAAASEPVPKDGHLVELLLECGAVFHDEVSDNVRLAAVRIVNINDVTKSPVLLHEAFYQHGLLDDPTPRNAAWTIYDSKGRMKVRSFWAAGLLNDPAPGVPAIIKFASVCETLFDHNKSFGLNPFSGSAEESMAEKYRAYFSMGVMRDLPQEPAEQWRQPYDGQIYCAHSVDRNKYLTLDELKALNTVFKSGTSAMVAENPAPPTSPLPQNKPKSPFSYRL